ncbi:MAG TPA: oxygen-independent coproporphyrinogen III oxidase [Betaproteobacteria bacterium]|nr:oxygen-independent coproporphyrinogen III oxidase [Betaproteobacteria bacterium]
MELALLEKYSKAGPRYTSYPTAPYFTGQFGERQWLDELRQGREAARDLSLYVHIPFCDTLCYYCGCNMVATRNYDKARDYLTALFQEIDRVAELTSARRVVRQLHWGGGTPTYLHPEDIRRLFAQLAGRFSIGADAEISCEIDPRELTRAHVQALRDCGFNRVSLGVQDLNDQVQRAVNRIQSESLIREVFGWLRDAGFDSINIDLMVGLPHQTAASYKETLDKIVALNPDRLAIFNYAHVPWMKKHQTLIVEADLPSLSTRLALQQQIMAALTAAGYVYIGMDHYAKHDDEIVRAQQEKTLYRNFQGYTTHKHCDIYAFGASAISQTDDVYVQNVKKLADYQRLIGEGRLPVERGLRVSREDKLRRDAITRLMCDLEVDKARFGAQWGIDFDTYFSDALEELSAMARDGLVELTADKIIVTAVGRIFLRNIAMPFDAYLKQSSDEQPRFSKTV